MPVIVLLTLGIIEYGWLFYKSYEIGNAARVGARQAAMPSGVTREVEATVDNLLEVKANIKKAYITRTVTPSPVEKVPKGDTVTVTIDVAYKDGIGLTKAPLLPVPAKLHASVTMNKEGFGP